MSVTDQAIRDARLGFSSANDYWAAELLSSLNKDRPGTAFPARQSLAQTAHDASRPAPAARGAAVGGRAGAQDVTGFTEMAAAGPVLVAVAVSALAGLVSFASPCVVPLVPGSQNMQSISRAQLSGARQCGA